MLTPDTIVPDPANPQAFNRYSYALNNPVKYTDPSGHISCDVLGTEECTLDGDGNSTFVDAPPTPKEILDNYSGKEPLPPGGDEIDVTVWLYRQMIGNANGQDAQDLRNAWNNNLFSPNNVALKAYALLGFKNLVDYGEAWDFKEEFVNRNIKTVTLAGHKFRMDIVANIHYGYLGEDIGFPDVLLYGGAGIAQQLGPRPELGRWWAYGDQPEDMSAISLGIHMRQDYGANLSYDEFVYAIDLWVDNGWLNEYLVP